MRLGTFKLLGAGLYSLGGMPVFLIFGIWCNSNSRDTFLSLQFANFTTHFHLSKRMHFHTANAPNNAPATKKQSKITPMSPNIAPATEK